MVMKNIINLFVILIMLGLSSCTKETFPKVISSYSDTYRVWKNSSTTNGTKYITLSYLFDITEINSNSKNNFKCNISIGDNKNIFIYTSRENLFNDALNMIDIIRNNSILIYDVDNKPYYKIKNNVINSELQFENINTGFFLPYGFFKNCEYGLCENFN